MLRTIVLVICLLSIVQAAAFSDIVQLKDGSVIKGIILTETEDFIKLKTSIAVFTLPKSDVEQIQRGTSEESEEFLKQWNERKRQLKQEVQRARQEEKAKTAVTERKGVSGSRTQGVYEKSKKGKSKKPSYQHGLDSILTNNYANRTLQYYYYIPGTILENKNKTYPLLVMIPWLSGGGEYFVTHEFKGFAYKNRFAIIAPSFKWDSKNWRYKQSYQYPKVWSGDALLEIINKFKKEHNIRISKFYLFGFSAGAQFALRFSLWKPELSIACAAHGSGGDVEPITKVNVKFFITCGTQDAPRIRKAKNFYDTAKKYNIDVVYKEYGAEHSLTAAQIEDSLKFFEKNL